MKLAIWTLVTATLAAFIGAGGLGVPIVGGLQLTDVNLIVSCALPVTVSDVLADKRAAYISDLVNTLILPGNPSAGIVKVLM